MEKELVELGFHYKEIKGLYALFQVNCEITTCSLTQDLKGLVPQFKIIIPR